MDLNELLHAHQLAVMKASNAGDAGEHQNQFDQIALFAKRIRLLRTSGGRSEGDIPFVHGEMPREVAL